MTAISRTLIASLLTLAPLACSSGRPTAAPAPPSVLPLFVIPNSPTSSFSPVVRVGNILFVSGQLGTGGAAAGGIKGETTAAMTRISELLKQAGSSLERVAKCTVMLADMNDWAAMNEAYIAFFPTKRPARSSFGTNGLAMGGHVEIECIATVD